MDIDPLITLAGAFVGFIVGLTGMGGGALMTPILVLFFHIQPLAAVSSDLVASMLMKPVGGGVHWKKGTVNFQLVGWLMLGSVPSAFFSVWALSHIQNSEQIDHIVKITIGVALLLASAGLVAKEILNKQKLQHQKENSSAKALHIYPGRTFAIGLFGGIMVGVTSVGSGSLMIVLLLLLYPTIAAKELVGTDLVQAIPLVATAAIAHMLFGEVKFDLTGSLLIGALPGVYVGAHISSRAADYVIRPLLLVVLLASGSKMLNIPTELVGLIALIASIYAFWQIQQARKRTHTSESITDVKEISDEETLTNIVDV